MNRSPLHTACMRARMCARMCACPCCDMGMAACMRVTQAIGEEQPV